MTEIDELRANCPSCGKPAAAEPCCEFSKAGGGAIPALAEVVTPEGTNRLITSRWLRIGRDDGNDIVLNGDTYASRFHAWITFEQERFWIEDLGSTNGTLLNGARLKRRELLASGDKIKIGESEMTFVLLDKTGASS
jgi:pSer/pThr/pTyr-binding forkhead associated (FHA) protein